MPSPCTWPPRIGITRRVPQPMSPAMIGAPTFIARLKTYFVWSTERMIDPSLNIHPSFRVRRFATPRNDGVRSSRHACRQPQRQYREQDQDHQPDQVGYHERDHAAEDRRKGHVLDHAL